VSLLVLDTSAIVAYAGGSVDVGGPMAEVGDSGGVVVAPVVCLVEAAREVDDHMLRVLVENPVCELEPLTGERWPMAATTVRMLGRLDLAVSLIAASANDGFLLTGEPTRTEILVRTWSSRSADDCPTAVARGDAGRRPPAAAAPADFIGEQPRRRDADYLGSGPA
jgi:hypothetical protein